MPASVFNLQRLREGVKPFRLHWFPRLSSTSDQAIAMRRAGRLFAPAVVLTARQTAGRGRGRNTWYSAGGSLTATFALPIGDEVLPHQLPLIAGLAARNAAAELTNDNGVQLKWPNDLLYGGRKLGGLLCERIDKADLVGIGLNVNLDAHQAPTNLRERIASLAGIKREPLDVTTVLIVLSRHLRQMLLGGGERAFSDVLMEYDSHHALVGRKVSVAVGEDQPVLSGRVEGLDNMGRLLLRSRTTLHHVISGQVQGGY